MPASAWVAKTPLTRIIATAPRKQEPFERAASPCRAWECAAYQPGGQLRSLEDLCRELKAEVPETVDISHAHVNFEEEIERMPAGEIDKDLLDKPRFDP